MSRPHTRAEEAFEPVLNAIAGPYEKLGDSDPYIGHGRKLLSCLQHYIEIPGMKEPRHYDLTLTGQIGLRSMISGGFTERLQAALARHVVRKDSLTEDQIDAIATWLSDPETHATWLSNSTKPKKQGDQPAAPDTAPNRIYRTPARKDGLPIDGTETPNDLILKEHISGSVLDKADAVHLVRTFLSEMEAARGSEQYKQMTGFSRGIGAEDSAAIARAAAITQAE